MIEESGKPLVLVVEDEAIFQRILVETLSAAGFAVRTAVSGEEARAVIAAQAAQLDVILLDRLLPDMDALTLLPTLKADPTLLRVPVILQTAMVREEDVAAGLAAGAYYYLTKPFPAGMVLSIVQTAWRDRQEFLELRRNLASAHDVLRHLRGGEFEFSHPAEARQLATLLAYAAPDPARVVLGLTELMLNAIEHGNLEISYDEKSALIAADGLAVEIERRLADPRWQARRATVAVERSASSVSFLIRDEGRGFAWENFLEILPERAFDTHGRGIAMARMLSFDSLEYRGRGNEVMCRINAPVAGSTTRDA